MCVDVPCKHLCVLYLKVAITQNQINLFQGASRKSEISLHFFGFSAFFYGFYVIAILKF